jgi:hypothetical protein
VAEIKNGHPLDSRELARRLRKYDIHNKPVRIGGVVVRGYTAESFWDAWTRYLVTDVADPTNEASPINTGEVIREEEGSGEVVEALGPSPKGSVTSVTPVTNTTAPTCQGQGSNLSRACKSRKSR